jgi:hypothetical protein
LGLEQTNEESIKNDWAMDISWAGRGVLTTRVVGRVAIIGVEIVVAIWRIATRTVSGRLLLVILWSAHYRAIQTWEVRLEMQDSLIFEV